MSSTLLRFAVFAVGGRAGVATDVTCREPLRASNGYLVGSADTGTSSPRMTAHTRGSFLQGEKSVAADLLELASLPLSTRASSAAPRITPIMAATMLRPRCSRSTWTLRRPLCAQSDSLLGVNLLDFA